MAVQQEILKQLGIPAPQETTPPATVTPTKGGGVQQEILDELGIQVPEKKPEVTGGVQWDLVNQAITPRPEPTLYETFQQLPELEEKYLGRWAYPTQLVKTFQRSSLRAVPHLIGGFSKFVGNLYKSFPEIMPSAPITALQGAIQGKKAGLTPEETVQHTKAKMQMMGMSSKTSSDKLHDTLLKIGEAPGKWAFLRPTQKTVEQMSSFKDHPVMFSLHHGVGAVPEFAAAIGIAALTGVPLAGAATLAIPQAAQFYDQAKNAGMSDRGAGTLMVASAAGLTLLETIPIVTWLRGHKIIGKIGGKLGLMGSPFAVRAMMSGVQGTIEGVEEVAQEYYQNILKRLTFDKGQSLNILQMGVGAHFWPGAVLGTVFGPFSPDIDLALKEMRRAGLTEEQIERVIKDITVPMAHRYGISTEIAEKIARALVTQDDKYLEGIDRENMAQIVENRMTTVHEESRLRQDDKGQWTPQTEERSEAMMPLENRIAADKIGRKVAPFVRIKLGSGKKSTIKWDELDPAVRETILKEIERGQNEQGKDFKPKQFIQELFDTKYANTVFWTGTKKDIDENTLVWHRGMYIPITEVVTMMDKLGVGPEQIDVIALRYGGAHAQGVTAQIAERLLANIKYKEPKGFYAYPEKPPEGPTEPEKPTKPTEPMPDMGEPKTPPENPSESDIGDVAEEWGRTDDAADEKTKTIDTDGYLSPQPETYNTTEEQRKEAIALIGEETMSLFQQGKTREAWDTIGPIEAEQLAQIMGGMSITEIQEFFNVPQQQRIREGAEEIEIEDYGTESAARRSVGIETKGIKYMKHGQIFDISHDYLTQIHLVRKKGLRFTAKTLNELLTRAKNEMQAVLSDYQDSELQDFIDESLKRLKITGEGGAYAPDTMIAKHPYDRPRYPLKKGKKAEGPTMPGKPTPPSQKTSPSETTRVVKFPKPIKIKDASGKVHNINPNHPFFVYPQDNYVRIKDDDDFLITWTTYDKLIKQKQFVHAQPEDIIGGGRHHVPGKEHINVGPDGKDAYRYSMLQKGILQLLKMRGYDEEWLFTHAPQFLKDYMYPKPSPEAGQVMGVMAREWIQNRRMEKLFHQMGLRAMDLIYRAVEEQVDKELTGKRRGFSKIREKDAKMKLYQSLMCFAAEEVGHNEGDPTDRYWLTENGRGKPYKDIGQKTSVERHLKRFHEALGKKYTPSVDRPPKAFFSLLPVFLQNTIIWSKANFEGPMLKGMLDVGRLDNANIFKRAILGFNHRLWDYTDPQKRGGGYNNALGSQFDPGAKYDTYAEFYDNAGKDAPEGSFLLPIDNYGASMSHYIRESMTSIQQTEIIKRLKLIPNPWIANANLVEYEHNWKDKPDEKGEKREGTWHLTKMRYRKVNTAPGLTNWYKGSYRVPWVPDYIYETINMLYNPRLSPNVGIKIWKWINGLVKRFVMPTPHLFYGQIQSSPVLYLPQMVKYAMPLVPTITSVVGGMMGGTMGGFPGAAGGSLAGYVAGGTLLKGLQKAFPKFGIPPEILDKGLREGWATMKKNEKRFKQYEGIDPKKLVLFTRYGMPAFSFNWMMASFFDKLELRHPQERGPWRSAWNWVSTKGGVDSYVFDYLIPKMVYETTDAFYEQFRTGKVRGPLRRIGKLGEGYSEDVAAEMACTLVANLTGVLENTIYNKEGEFLQATLFARNFTMGLARLISGASWGVWTKALGHKYRTLGFGKYTNSLFHGDTSEPVMKALWWRYARHLLVMVPMMRYLMANLIQYGLSFFADDEKERGNSFTWNNDRYRHMSIRIPESEFLKSKFGLHGKDRFGHQVYIDPLYWREAPQFADIISLPDQGRGSMRLALSKLNYGVNLVLSLLTDTDIGTGADIYGITYKGDYEEVGWHERVLNTLRHGGKTALPSAARTDYRKPEMFGPLSLMGMPLRYGGIPWQEGYTRQEVLDALHKIGRDRYKDDMMAKKKRTATDEELREMMNKGEISPQEYFNLKKKEGSPVSYMLRRNFKTLLESGYWRR